MNALQLSTDAPLQNDHHAIGIDLTDADNRPIRKRAPNKRYLDEERQDQPTAKKRPTKSKAEELKSSQEVNISLKEGILSRDILVRGIRAKNFKKIVFLTGAGISVAAGIPDFRTPKTGLYAQLKAFGLPHPEEIFSLEFLLHSPQPFYAVANRYLQHTVEPTLAHHFIKQFVDQGTLAMDYTQNIDGLELDVGIPPELLVQAHGHMRAAHCSSTKCRAEADMRLYTRYIKREEVLYCKVCKEGIVKPDIVFFGEKLPKEFKQKFARIGKADLVFVMGTSLKVKPFSTLLSTLPETTPLVVINHTNPTAGAEERKNFLFLEGDIEQTVAGLMQDIGWCAEPSKGRAKGGKGGKKKV